MNVRSEQARRTRVLEANDITIRKENKKLKRQVERLKKQLDAVKTTIKLLKA